MSNLFKSKFLIGVMVVAVMFVVAGVVKTPTAAASTACTITSTLKVGSSGAEVVCLQTALGGLTADGSFGPKTKAAVMAWQTKEGLVADGVFGAKSRAMWEENAGNSANFPAGCTSTVGFSTTTGASCANAVGAYPAGCTSSVGFSPTTGGSCATTTTLVPGCNSYVGFSPTTGASCATGVTSNLPTNPTGAGNISADSILGGFANTIVGVGDQNHQVAGFQLTGAGGGSDLTLNNATIQLLENGSGSSRMTDYFSAVSLMENGVVIGSVPASAFSSNNVSGVNNYVYSASMPLTNATIKAGQQNNFYIAITANTSMDSGNYGVNTWYVAVNNIRFTDGTGTTLVYNPLSFGAITTNTPSDPVFSFGSAASANNLVLELNRSTSDQNAHTVTVNTTGSSTQKVPLLAIDVYTQGGQTISINKLPVNFSATGTSTSAASSSTSVSGGNVRIGALANEVYLMSGTTVLDSEAIPATDGTNSGTNSATQVVFKINSSSPLLVSGTKQTLTIAADINSTTGGAYVGGANIIASTPAVINGGILAPFDLTSGTPNGSELLTVNNAIQVLPGTATGQQVAFYATGVSVAVSNYTCGPNPANATVAGGPAVLTCTIPFSVTATGAPAYIPQLGNTSTTPATNKINFVAQNSSGVTVGTSGNISTSVSISQSGSNALTDVVATGANTGAAEWTLNAGQTANFVANFVLSDASPYTGGQYRAYMVSLPWSASSGNWAQNSYSFNLGYANNAVPGFSSVQ